MTKPEISITFKFLTGFILTGFFFLAGCGSDDYAGDESKTIILAHAMHPSHPVSVAMAEMAKNVEELSEGNLRLKIYPAGQLGGERKLLELIQIRMIGMTKVSAGTLENIVPAARVFSLPYLFRDKEHVFNVLDSELGAEILEEGTPYQLKGIAYYDAGSRSIYTVDRPVHTPEDLEGLKIRVMESVIAMQLMRTLNGSPTPLAWGELYTAFQGGIVDGAENNPPSFYTSRHYEVCKYYTLNEHTTIPDVLVIGTKVWEQLTEQQRDWLQLAVDQSVEFQRELWRESEIESIETFRNAGVEIIEPDKELFRSASQPIYERIEQHDPELYRWVERIRQIN